MKKWWVLVVCAVLFGITPVWAQSPQTQAVAQTEFTGAVIKEQDVTFAIVVVKPYALNDKKFADGLIDALEPSFGGIPVVLMVQDIQGTPTYYGRKDIAEFMAKVPLDSVPWKKYALKQVSQ